jgi:hypothetical protein
MQASGLRRRLRPAVASIRSTGSAGPKRCVPVEGLVGLLIVLLILLVGAALLRPFVSVVTVHDYERGLRYRRGRFSGLVDPGTHLGFRPFS